MRNLDTTALRSFVAVAESGGVTRAAGFLNLTQSAVSMQLKRLEEVIGQKLLERSGRGVVLTRSGQQLLGYAQRIVALNDEVYGKLTERAWEGEIVLGVPHDIMYPAIPRVMKRMQSAFPRVKLQLHSSYTFDLKSQFARGAADIVLTTEARPDAEGEVLLEVPLRWYGAPGGQVAQQRPLRVAFCSHCGFRPGAIAALEAADIAWEHTVAADSDRAIEVAVSADMAVTAVLEGHAHPYFEQVPASVGLPDLGLQRIGMYVGAAQPQLTEPLARFLRDEFAALSTGRADVAAE